MNHPSTRRTNRKHTRFLGWFLLGMVGPLTAEAQMIVAHRGASEQAPENTLAAFRLAWELGADAIEGDFYLTRDGHIVALHDDTTKRTAGVDWKVADSTLETLRALDVGLWKGPEFQGEPIPTLAEVLVTVPPGKRIFIEIKCGPEIVPPLKQVLDATSLRAEQTIVISFHESVISAVKEQMPEIHAYWLTGYKRDKETQQWNPSLDTVLTTLKRTGADGLDTQGNREVVDQAFVDALRAAGHEFHVWTINEPDDARYFQQLGVDSITTDRPDAVRAALTAPSD
jgi:glycerophosphoryl diester phosphodiesterase